MTRKSWTFDADWYQSRQPPNRWAYAAPRAWDCGGPKCKAKGPCANHPKRKTCWYCTAPRGHFEAIRSAKQQVARDLATEDYMATKVDMIAEVEVPVKKKRSRKQRARDALKSKDATPPPPTPATLSTSAPPQQTNAPSSPHAMPVKNQTGSQSSCAGGTNHRVAFPPEKLAEMQELAPAFELVLSSIAKEWIPAPRTEEPSETAEDAAKRLLEGKPTAPDDAPIKRAEDKAAKLRQALTILPDGSPAATAAKEELATTEKEIESLKKKAPSEEAQRCGQQQAIANFKAEVQARKDRRKTGAEKAINRAAVRLAHLTKLQQQIEIAKSSLQTLESRITETHRQRDDADGERDQLILQCLERHTPTSVEGGSAESQLQSPAAPSPAQISSLEARLDQMEKQHQEERKAVRTAWSQQRAAEEAFSTRVASITIDDLPTLELPSGPDLMNQGQLHSLLGQWVQSGATAPFTFGEVVKHTAMAAAAPDFFKKALGDLWTKFFSPDPQADDIVPKQMAELVLASLERLRHSWEAVNDISRKIEREAAGSFSALTATGKKRRADAYDAIMG